MKILTYFLIASLLTSSLALADDVVQLDKGAPAPFSGFLITREKAISIRNQDLDLGLANKMVDLTKQENVLLNDQLTKADDHIKSLSDQLVASRDSAWISKVGFFLLGAASATLVAYGVTRVIK